MNEPKEIMQSTSTWIRRCTVCDTALAEGVETCPRCKPTEKTVPKLKSLEDHDRERYARHDFVTKERPNGIACPKCGAELIDTMPNCVLASLPPRLAISCLKCAWTGSRVL